MDKGLRDAFLTDVADAVRFWTAEAERTVGDDPAALAAATEALRGLAHSMLVILDGGTRSSDGGQVVFLTDRHGREIADVLHERLFDFLPD